MKPDDPVGLSRRSLLKLGPACLLSLIVRGLVPPLRAASGIEGVVVNPEDDAGVMDEALDLLRRYGPEYGGGLSNHAPMAAEALVSMGRADAVLPWIELYKDRLAEPPGTVAPISAKEWKDALGDSRRVGDWIVFFERELEESPWPQVLGQWLPRLSPGLVGAATHCVIRTAHAARGLAASDTAQRRNELARGLGYWAARYKTLPGAPSDPGKLSPSEAIGEVDLLPDGLRRPPGLISQEIAALEDFPAFADTINLVAPSKGKPDFLSNLTSLFAEIYLQYAERHAIAWVHAVTGPGALRLLAPYVDSGTRPTASLYAWQAAAAIYATYAGRRYAPRDPQAGNSPDELVDLAVSNGSAHVIKFTEVCLREYRVNPNPVYLAAARDAIERMRPLR